MKHLQFALTLSLSFYYCYAIIIVRNTDIVINNIKDQKTVCKEVKCLALCCKKSYIVGSDSQCIPYKGSQDFSNVTVYTDDIYETGKTLRDLFKVIPGKFENITFSSSAYELTQHGLKNYLTEDGIVYLETPNAYRRWTLLDTDHFCVDYQSSNDSDLPKARFFIVLEAEEGLESNMFFTTALFISCVFMALTLMVYAILPELRNLSGMVLMAYVASQLGAYLMLGIVQIGQHEDIACLILTALTYFFFLSSFCWMNVMSIDIWWTFRGYAKARRIHRRGELFKFFIYCSYAWGVPLCMTIVLLILNESDLSRIPWLITPKIPRLGCFLEGGEKLLYLYVPMLILILCNWIFFLMTAFNIWRLSRDVSVLTTNAAAPAAHGYQRYRFLVYMKLSVIMGISWVLEVISLLKPQLSIWYFTDAYNLLIGVVIFIIFVWKRKIGIKIEERFQGFRMTGGFSTSRRQHSSNNTMESSLSRDASNVSFNPHDRYK